DALEGGAAPDADLLAVPAHRVQPVVDADLGGDVGVLAGDAAQVRVQGVDPAADDHGASRAALGLVPDQPLQFLVEAVLDAERPEPDRGGQGGAHRVAEPLLADEVAGAVHEPLALEPVEAQEAVGVDAGHGPQGAGGAGLGAARAVRGAAGAVRGYVLC